MADLPPGYEDVAGFDASALPVELPAPSSAGVPEAAPAEEAGEAAAAPNADSIYNSDLTFSDLNLHPDILDALMLDMKFERPSKIQALTLPRVLAEPDRHMIAQGHNGCGKTTCFTLAMLMRCVSAPIPLLYDRAAARMRSHSNLYVTAGPSHARPSHVLSQIAWAHACRLQ